MPTAQFDETHSTDANAILVYYSAVLSYFWTIFVMSPANHDIKMSSLAATPLVSVFQSFNMALRRDILEILPEPLCSKCDVGVERKNLMCIDSSYSKYKLITPFCSCDCLETKWKYVHASKIYYRLMLFSYGRRVPDSTFL